MTRTLTFILVVLLAIGCKNPTNEQKELLVALGIVSVAYLICKEGNSGGYAPAAPAHPPICQRGNYQGCCSHHKGILGCVNYKVVCQDETISPTCTCPSSYCVFSTKDIYYAY